jgi:hypothetical protein
MRMKAVNHKPMNRPKGTLALQGGEEVSAELFGKVNVKQAYSLVFTAWGVSGLVSAHIGGLLRDITVSYTYPMYLSAATSSTASLLLLSPQGQEYLELE